jgi:amidohydrolase
VDELRRDADRLAADLVAWRRELHRHPELGFEEHRTAAFAAERLRALGFEVRTGLARTGVVARLAAKSASRPPVLLRADLDGLPIQEEAGREYGSEVRGAMHACGHDGHVAMLIGAASLLASRRDALPQDVIFCFQPAEEGLGGAKAMIEAGVLEFSGAKSAFALHLWTPYPSGTLHVRPGPIMAAQDEFLATVTGRGGHGAQPHLAADPIVAAAAGIVALQSIVARSVDPMEPAVVTVGSLHAGSAPNVIPDEARMHGTLRSFREDVRVLLRERVQQVLDGTARAAGCRCDVTIRPGYPPVVNDPAAVERVRRAGRAVLGAEGVIESPPLAASEDFAYFLREVPGAFALLGAGGPGVGGRHAPHHSPRFDFDESVLPRGAELLARIALEA